VKNKTILVASLSILIIGIVGFSSFDQQQGLEGTDYLATSTDYIIAPTVTSASVEKSVVEPTHTVITPDVQKGTATMPSEFLLPLLQSADAVTSTQDTISVKEWNIDSSDFDSNKERFAIDSSGNIFTYSNTSNKILRLDTTTNTLTTWTIPTTNAGVRSMDVDSSGNIYFTENSLAKIARLDPSTNVVTEWSFDAMNIVIGMLDKVYLSTGNLMALLDPSTNTITTWNTGLQQSGEFVIDSTGNVFVTLSGIQSGIGQLDTSTDIVTSWLTPTVNSDTLGITITSSGTIYFTEDGANKIGRLVPSTNTVTEWLTPEGSVHPRAIIVDSMENVFFADLEGPSHFNRLVPSTNVFTEWNMSTLGLKIDSSDTIYFIGHNGVGIIT